MWSRYLKLYKGTKAEAALEPAIAAAGIPYRFQMPVWRYVIDFAWHTHKVAIEVDGESHRRPAQLKKDKQRTEYLESLGWRVFRVQNEKAIADPEGTVRWLLAQAGLES